jgi:aminopeptidase N
MSARKMTSTKRVMVRRQRTESLHLAFGELMRAKWFVAPAVTLVVAVSQFGVPVASAQSDRAERPKENPGTPGASGFGDPFFPFAGNGGYDVSNYDLKLTWDPSTGVLTGDAKIEAKTLQSLSRFNLDLVGFTVSTVDVNERPATFVRLGQELVITPARAVEAREDLKVRVRYQGVPQTVIDPDGALDGWIPTPEGAIALSEPQGTPSWYPVNDNPNDKATLSLSMTVPSNLSVLSNGLPEDPEQRGSNTTYRWRERKPMASYLSTIAIGKFKVTKRRTSAGIPIINATDSVIGPASQPSIDRIGEILDWETTLLGAYPFESVGAIAVNAPDVGYALETQTRPVFTFEIDDSTMVHELAHQWLGNSVTLSNWPDIWLHEGFATYFEWLWSEKEGGDTPAVIANQAYDQFAATSRFWTVAPAALPGPDQLFTAPAYLRGAMTLQALRTEIGDAAFFQTLKTWVQTHQYGNVNTADFIALAQSVSGKNLSALFNTWLISPTKPAASPAPQTVGAATSARTKRAPVRVDRRAKPVA